MNALFVIVPNWNGIFLIRECLRALQRQTLPHTVIVVDNGSTDRSNDVVFHEFPEVQLLELPKNAGFAGGVNHGIRHAMAQGAEYIALLNNDASPDPHWLKALVECAESDPRIGMVAAKILTYEDDEIDSTGDFYSIWGFPYPRGRGEEDEGQYDKPALRTIFAASGGASLYRVQTLREVGLFDERFFAYFEDVDLGFRARLAGFEVRYEPKAVVKHQIGATSSRMNNQGEAIRSTERKGSFARYHTVKNFCYLYTKNMPAPLYWKYLPLFMASLGMMFVNDVRRGLVLAHLRGRLTFWLNLPGVLAERRRIQSRRVLSPAQIDKLLTHALPPIQQRYFQRLNVKP